MFKFAENWQPITAQRVFDAAWQAFIVEDQQPAMSGDRGGGCVYLTEDGERKCAIGLLIPDGHPAQLHLKSIGPDMFDLFPGLFDDTDYRAPSHLAYLQLALHDNLARATAGGAHVWAFTKGERVARYRAVAQELRLTIPGERQ